MSKFSLLQGERVWICDKCDERCVVISQGTVPPSQTGWAEFCQDSLEDGPEFEEWKEGVK